MKQTLEVDHSSFWQTVATKSLVLRDPRVATGGPKAHFRRQLQRNQCFQGAVQLEVVLRHIDRLQAIRIRTAERRTKSVKAVIKCIVKRITHTSTIIPNVIIVSVVAYSPNP